MPTNRRLTTLISLSLVLVMLIAVSACRPADPSLEIGSQPAGAAESATATAEPSLAAATLKPSAAPAAPTQAAPSPAPTVAVQAPQLIVLHTNDTWGYYDPCG